MQINLYWQKADQWFPGDGNGKNCIMNGPKKHIKEIDMLILFTVLIILQAYTYLKLIILYQLNTCSLFYAKYTLIKLLKKYFMEKKWFA